MSRDIVLEALQAAYKKHYALCDDIGWEELSDLLQDALCELMGDTGFQKWVSTL